MDEAPTSEDEELATFAEEVYRELVDDVSLGFCFEVHRSCVIGSFFADEIDPETMKQYEIVDQPGKDVFGQELDKQPVMECPCPNCHRTIAASRFAPHLEKCMGMGRNSSRIASKRIANSGKGESDEDNDNDKDDDWSYTIDKKSSYKKLKRDKLGNSPRRVAKHRNNKIGSGDIPSVGSVGSIHSDPGTVNHIKPLGSQHGYEAMTLEERKRLLMNMCGVISEHTKKMCTRTNKCPQHSDEQRRAVRAQLLGHNLSRSVDPEQDIQVDVEVDDDSEHLSLQWELGSTNSTNSSSSTTNGSTVVIPKKARKSKQTQHTLNNITSKRGRKTRSRTPPSAVSPLMLAADTAAMTTAMATPSPLPAPRITQYNNVID